MCVSAIGLGETGSRLTQNLTANGFEVTHVDSREAHMTASHDMGGTPVGSVAEDAWCVSMRSA